MKRAKKYDKILKVVPNKDVRGGFIVTGYSKKKGPDGKKVRIRKHFSGPHAKERAQAFRDQQDREDEIGSKAQPEIRASHFTAEQEGAIQSLIDDLRADEKASPEDKKLPSEKLLKLAVQFYLGSTLRGKLQGTFSEVRAKYVQRRAFLETSKSHRDGVKSTYDAFAALFGDREISSVTKQEVEEFLERRGQGVASPGTRKIEKAHLNAIFNWAVKSDYLGENVVAKTDSVKIKRADPVSLTIEQIRELFLCADQIDGGSLIPYLSLTIFAALRPFEARRARWEDINWEEGTIEARQEKGSGYDRTVKLPEVCLAWLKYVDGPNQTEGSINPLSIVKYYNVLKAAAGFRIAEGSLRSVNFFGLDDKIKGSESKERPTWVRDCERHTGISYRLKIINNHEKVGWWAGNTPDIIRTHYQTVHGITEKTTKEFYSLTPESLGLQSP